MFFVCFDRVASHMSWEGLYLTILEEGTTTLPKETAPRKNTPSLCHPSKKSPPPQKKNFKRFLFKSKMKNWVIELTPPFSSAPRGL